MGVWIDSDMGVDDLFAILLTLQHRSVDGLSLSFGNAPLEQVCRNAAGAKQEFGFGMPIHCGAGRAILGQIETAERILGNTGMPSRGAGLPLVNEVFSPVQPLLAKWLEQQDGAEIIALGPLTNIAILALNRTDLIANIGQITWMGGGITRGNHTASAEFNAFADPEALAIILARDVPLTMVDLDACRRVEIVEKDVQSLKAGPLLRDLLGGYLDIALSRGRQAMALYDPVAAAALIQPELFEFKPARIDVELHGPHTRGRTVVDQRNLCHANARIVADLNAHAIKALCLSALERSQ